MKTRAKRAIVTYLYAGLGIVMLLPIMAGLQFAVALGELESANDAIVNTQQVSGSAANQQEMEYLQAEAERFLEALREPLQIGEEPFACVYPLPNAIETAGYALDSVAYSSACAFISEAPFSYQSGIEKKARIYVEFAGSGAADVVDACMVSRSVERCALEQERQAG